MRKLLFSIPFWGIVLFIISFIGTVGFASQFWAAVLNVECFIMAFWSFNTAEYLK